MAKFIAGASLHYAAAGGESAMPLVFFIGGLTLFFGGLIKIKRDRLIENIPTSKIRSIAFIPEKGKTYKGKVKSIMPYGAFIGISSNTDGLLHVSEIAWERVENVEDVLKEGQEIEVKLIDIDERSGKLKLSRKVLLPRPEKK